MLVPVVVHRVLSPVPVLSGYLVERLVASAAIVGLVVYVVMPRYTRLMARWLYK